MVLEVPGGLFGQKDVRETTETLVNRSKIARATWATQFASASTTFLDVTSATVTISGLLATKTYTLIAWVSTNGSGDSSGDLVAFKLVINGTDMAETSVESGAANDRHTIAINDALAAQTGSTSYVCKLQGKDAGGGWKANPAQVKSSIVIMAVEE